MIHIIEMREDDPHPPLVAANLVNRVLHKPEMRRQAFGAFLGNAFPVPAELVEHDARHDESDHAELHHFLNGAEHRHLPRVLRKVKPYAGVDKHLEHEVQPYLPEMPGRGAMIAARRLAHQLPAQSVGCMGEIGAWSPTLPYGNEHTMFGHFRAHCMLQNKVISRLDGSPNAVILVSQELSILS